MNGSVDHVDTGLSAVSVIVLGRYATYRYVLVGGLLIFYAIFLKWAISISRRVSQILSEINKYITAEISRSTERRLWRRNCTFLLALTLIHFSFYLSKNESNQTSLLVEGLHKFSARLRNKRPRYCDLQSDARCAGILILNWPVGI